MQKIAVSCPQCGGTGTIQLEARECDGCGTGFVRHDIRQVYCTAKCRHATNQRTFDRKKREKGGGDE